MPTGRQIREARELLGWTRAELARNTFLALPVVEVVEDHGSTFMLLDDQMRAICRAFDDAGVAFTPDGAQLKAKT
jgi:ribosome-binding protein aMBF1 (putative translation factor)